MAEVACFVHVDAIQHKTHTTPANHHQASCKWYNWNSFPEKIPAVKNKPIPSDIFEHRSQRLMDRKKIHKDSIKLSCKANEAQIKSATDANNNHINLLTSSQRPQSTFTCDSKILLNQRTLVPGGEARDYNIYAFSQHDNRHKICLPAKKHHQNENSKILQQHKSSNVTETLNWDHKNPGNPDGFNNVYYQRRENIPSYLSKDISNQKAKIDDVNCFGPVGVPNKRFPRFPKVHNDSREKYLQHLRIFLVVLAVFGRFLIIVISGSIRNPPNFSMRKQTVLHQQPRHLQIFSNFRQERSVAVSTLGSAAKLYGKSVC